MAFFALFSIAPLFLLLLSFLDRLFGIGSIRGEVYTAIVQTLGAPSADAVRALLLQRTLFDGHWSSIVVNVVLTAIGSAALFRHMQRCLAVIWSYHEGPHRGARYIVHSFLRSFLAVGTLTVFVVGGLFVLASGVLLGPVVKHVLVGYSLPSVWPVLFAWLSLVATTGIFSVLYATLSPSKPSWRRVSIASLVVFASLIFAKVGIGSFAQSKSIFSLFGAGSAVIYLLLWCFFLSQIFLFAAIVAGVRTEK